MVSMEQSNIYDSDAEDDSSPEPASEREEEPEDDLSPERALVREEEVVVLDH